jgi:hypothetical protein
MQVKKIIFVTLVVVLSVAAKAQNRQPSEREIKKAENRERIKELIKQEEEGAIIFQRQTTFGVKLNTDGYGMFLELGRLKTPRKTNLYSLEIGERRHPKEEKLTRGVPGFSIGNPFFYGKINNFYYAKLGLAQQRMIGGKGNKNGVAVSAIYGGGFSAGLLKPYYIRVNDPNDGQLKDIKYNNNDSVFLAADIINGAAGFGKGFGEMKFKPGLFAKGALRFDYGRYNEMVSALEVGLNAEFYASKMPMMLRNKDKQFFFNAYVAIVFGKRK